MTSSFPMRRAAARSARWCAILTLVVAAAACSATDDADVAASDSADTTVAATSESTKAADAGDQGDADDSADDRGAVASADCEAVAALFGTDGSANPDLPDPEASAVCAGDTIEITANGIPDYPYVETSPGPPREQDIAYSIPATPVVAESTTDVPLLGPLGITLAGIPIYGPTEGTGGDVGSLPGILMDCGGHNGPTGFHLHIVGTSEMSECDFSAEEIASGPQWLGYAFDGYPIYTGHAQFTSSWTLSDESLFATDTWNAHTYVEGSGDLDQCNGRTDEDGNYAYYTTDTFPYVLGCFVGEVSIVEAGGPDGERAGGGEGGERPARPEDGERPARPEDVDGEATPPEEEDE